MSHTHSAPIYLDANSTTAMLPEVIEAMVACHAAGFMNPASPHREGRRARRRLEEAREAIAKWLGARCSSAASDRLIFTSGGTESNNLALRGMAGDPPGRIVLSRIEHPSVTATANYLKSQGFQLAWLPCDPRGVTQIDSLERLLLRPTRLVSIMLGNNETGVLQPVKRAAEICQRFDVPLHTDAVQAVGKIDVNFTTLGVTALSFSAHKFHGPRGIGGLLLRDTVNLQPITFGGSQQMGARPGTESVASVVGMQRALELYFQRATARRERMASLRDQLEQRIVREQPVSVVHGASADRLPHTLNVSFPGCDRQALLMALDRSGVACSTGSACASGSQEPSPVLIAMGCDRSLVDSSIRISLATTTTSEEVDRAADVLLEIVGQIRAK